VAQIARLSARIAPYPDTQVFAYSAQDCMRPQGRELFHFKKQKVAQVAFLRKGSRK
jgi:hypothetical protein